MHAEAFTLFPATVITADTNTAAFDCSNMNAFIVRMTLAALGTSQGCRPVLQMLMPDGTTWVTIHTPATQQTTNASFIYQYGRSVAAVTPFIEGYLGGIPKVCRILLDVVNANNATVTIEIIPIPVA